MEDSKLGDETATAAINTNNITTTGRISRPSGRKEIYDEDSGIILCICGFEEDDGFTIQCERCNVWQHAQCVDISEDDVPDIYYCDKCDTNPNRVIDVKSAIERQRKLNQQNQVNNNNSNNTTKRRKGGTRGNNNNNNKQQNTNGDTTTSNSSNQTPTNGINNTAAAATNNTHYDMNGTNGNYSQKDAEPKLDSNNNDIPRPALPPAPPKRGNRGGKQQRLTVQASKVGEDGAASESDNNQDQDISKYFISASSYKSFYVKVDDCRIPRALKHKIEPFLNSTALELCHKDDQCSFISSQEYNNISPAKVSVKFAYENQKQKFYGFSKFGLFAESAIPRDRFIIEFVGDIMSLEDYKSNPINQYRFFGCPKPGVLFYDNLGLAIDGRLIGSEASFIRRSCRPNVKISTMVIDDKTIRFAAFATEPIKSGTELSIGWDWDIRHPVGKILNNNETELNKAERQCLLRTADMIHQRGMDCACNKSYSDCILSRIRKIGMTAVDSTFDEQQQKSHDETKSIGYSAREERKLQGAMSLIDKMDNKGKNKRKSAESSNESQRDEISQQEKEKDQNNSDKAIQTEPIVKKLRPNDSDDISVNSDSTSPSNVVTLKSFTRIQNIRSRYLLARQQYLENHNTNTNINSQNTSAVSSPILPSIGPNSKTASPSPTTNTETKSTTSPEPSSIKLPSAASAITSTTSVLTTTAATTASPTTESSYTTKKPEDSSLTSSPSLTATTITPSSNNAGPPQKKKLSFADYKKKQKPPTPSNVAK